MKARGMLWRRVVDTSQEDRCDRRISTPVPSGLRSHHAFTALWKLLFTRQLLNLIYAYREQSQFADTLT